MLEDWIIEASQDVIQQVATAFSCVTRPDLDVFLAKDVDVSGFHETESLIQHQEWQEITFRELMDSRDSLSFVGSLGYKYLLPAFICEGLKKLHSCGNELLSPAINSLSPENYLLSLPEGELSQFAKELQGNGIDLNSVIRSHDEGSILARYEQLTQRQRQSICLFLELASLEDVNLDYSLARFALSTYWKKFK